MFLALRWVTVKVSGGPVGAAVSNCWTGLWTGLVDWIAGLDYWTGLLDPTKLPVKAMMHV